MLAKGVSSMRTSLIRDILGRAWELEGQGRRIVHLGVGQPNFAAPACAVAASREAVEELGMQRYIANAGLSGLRAAIAGDAAAQQARI